MPKKFINIFVIIMFLGIGVTVMMLNKSTNNLHQELVEATLQDMHSISFYKDPIRDSSGLDLPITEPADLEEFIYCINNLQQSNISVKSYTVIEQVKIRFRTISEKPKSLEIKIRRTEELGNKALITIAVFIANGTTSGGTYTSDDFLPWLTSISEKPGFEMIWE